MKFEEWLSQQNCVIEVDCGCVTTEAFYHWMRVAYEAGNSPVIPDAIHDALLKALAAMEFMGDALNNLDAVCTEDVEFVSPAFDAVRNVLAVAPQEVKSES
ncbi:TPA: hypothetical protein I8Y35_000148 [Klebsiella oxytoca]|nr:hypothetical protein [Klebsiella oxytoca]